MTKATIEKKALFMHATNGRAPTFFSHLANILHDHAIYLRLAASATDGFLPSPSLFEEISVDWQSMHSVENALIGINWVSIYFPETSAQGPARDRYVHDRVFQLHQLIDAMIRVSGKSLRLLVIVDATDELQFKLDRHWMGPVGCALRDASAIYRSQGLPIAVVGLLTPERRAAKQVLHKNDPDFTNVAKKLFDLFISRREFAPVQVF